MPTSGEPPKTPRELTCLQFQAMGHPLRVEILKRIRLRTSPSGLARELTDHPIGAIAYHVRVLLDAELIEENGTRRVRGAVEHRYRITMKGTKISRNFRDLERLDDRS